MMQELFDKKETYIGNNVQIDEQNIINVGVDEVIITDDKTKILMTNDIHFCICVIVIGENEVGMAHLNIDKTLSRKHCELLKKLYDIKNIKEINSFIGPKTTKEALTELNGCIPYNNYVSYINNPLGIDVATGNIAYDINKNMLYGYNDDGFVEYKKGYINALNCDELIKKM